jgi:hypothetical protein
VGSANTRVAVERSDWPCFAANRRNVATRRILSQSVVIGHWSDAKKVEFYRPDTPSPFPLLVEGLFPRIREYREASGRRGRATENILFRKSSAIALVVEALKHRPTDIETYGEVNGAKKRKISFPGNGPPFPYKR